MSTIAIAGIVALLVALVVVTEVAAAAIPLLMVITLVRPEERQQLAELLATVDRRRRLRFWPALRATVAARRARSVVSPAHANRPSSVPSRP